MPVPSVTHDILAIVRSLQWPPDHGENKDEAQMRLLLTNE